MTRSRMLAAALVSVIAAALSLRACQARPAPTNTGGAPGSYTFKATVVFSELGDPGSVPFPCNLAPVSDGMTVIVAHPTAIGDDPVALGTLEDGKRVPWSQTFPDQERTYPDSYPICTWTFAIPDVPAGLGVYAVEIGAKLRGLLREAEVRGGARLIVTAFEDKLTVLPALNS